MKKLLQFVAAFVVALLVAQPALAGLPCSAEIAPAGGCTPGCGMSMSQAQMGQMPSGQMSSSQMSSGQMSPDCPMSPVISSDGCQQNCCHTALLQAVAQPATGAKSNLTQTQQFVPAAQTLALASPAITLSPRTESSSTAPPRYILFQVFRI